MRTIRLSRSLAPLAALASLSACGRTRESHPTGPATIHLTGTTLIAPSGAPLGGVKVCAYAQHDIPCTTSDETGKFDALLPENSEAAATFELDGYTPVVVAYPTGTVPIEKVGVTIPLAGDRIATYGAFDAQAPAVTAGFVNAFVGTPSSPLGVRGVKVTLDPSGGQGPLYFGDDGNPAPDATATSDVSIAFFANVAPGEATLQFLGAPGLACRGSFGAWGSPGFNSVRIPVSAGFETHVAVTCVPAAPADGVPARPSRRPLPDRDR